MLKFLITGTGRCGTDYMSELFKSVGIRCGHEAIFNLRFNPKHNFHSVNLDADSSWLAVPFLNHLILKDAQIVHIFRNPLAIFRNWLYDLDDIFRIDGKRIGPFGEFIYKHCPGLKEIPSPISRAIHFYFTWNYLIFKKTGFDIENCLRVEDPPEINLQKLGIEYEGKEIFRKTNFNSRTKHQVSLTDVYATIAPKMNQAQINEMLKLYPEGVGV